MMGPRDMAVVTPDVGQVASAVEEADTTVQEALSSAEVKDMGIRIVCISTIPFVQHGVSFADFGLGWGRGCGEIKGNTIIRNYR